jgi:hypothetical protein
VFKVPATIELIPTNTDNPFDNDAFAYPEVMKNEKISMTALKSLGERYYSFEAMNVAENA